MSAKHTPGPWLLSDRNVTPLNVSTHATVAHVGDYRIGVETGVPGGNYRDGLLGDKLADAALIAAAPDLLAALRMLVSRCHERRWPLESEDTAPLNAARAAITKAEGRA